MSTNGLLVGEISLWVVLSIASVMYTFHIIILHHSLHIGNNMAANDNCACNIMSKIQMKLRFDNHLFCKSRTHIPRFEILPDTEDPHTKIWILPDSDNLALFWYCDMTRYNRNDIWYCQYERPILPISIPKSCGLYRYLYRSKISNYAT